MAIKDVRKDDVIEHMPVVVVGDQYLSTHEGVFVTAASKEKPANSKLKKKSDPFGPDVVHIGIG